MSSRISELMERIRHLEDELEAEVAARQAELEYRVERGRIVFEEEILARHRALRTRVLSYVAGAQPLVILTAPFIYAVIVPLLLLDLFVTVYQAVCFPVYRIAKVRRRDYIVFDRHALGYLNAVEKLNCAYCAYANGLIAYVREIASRTEQYWCPIKHAQRLAGAHARYPAFVEFGDAEAYRTELETLRAELRDRHD
ncbi:MAG: hypothetical protein LPL00_10415 [Alphaproteobacteria bacterium]|nr:hypothetical protein [Alphaproteobacteria bacterium]MDX5370084.1 hypothetical protein [Alphaproteobacteria bacterium]MDX5464661.1 hypothetical protein [Alphaproteobacteria bacterium]